MRPNQVVIQQPMIDLALKGRDVGRVVFSPTETLAAQGQVEAFNESLLILLVGSSGAMVVTERGGHSGKLGLKLEAVISLDGLAMTPAVAKDLQSCLTIFGGQAGA